MPELVQRGAVHQLHDTDPAVDADMARVIAAIAHPPGAVTERRHSLEPAAVVALQQRGLVRRHPGGGYLELTDVKRRSTDSAGGASRAEGLASVQLL